MSDKILEKLASRKFGLAVFVLLSSLGLFIFNLLTAALYIELVIYTLGLYFASNVSQDVIKDFLNSKRSVAVDSASK